MTLSRQDIIQAARALPPEELDGLVDEMIALRAREHAPSASHAETYLLQQIALALPTGTWERYHELLALRRHERLTEAQADELRALDDAIEKQHTARMDALARLASLRGHTLDQVMDELGIRPHTLA